jgi:glycerol kinase
VFPGILITHCVKHSSFLFVSCCIFIFFSLLYRCAGSQCKDVVSVMGAAPALIKVDGGVTQSDFLMQMLADIMDIPVERPANVETTALGAAISAGIGAGFWEDTQAVAALVSQPGKVFHPNLDGVASGSYARWQEAVKRSRGWSNIG